MKGFIAGRIQSDPGVKPCFALILQSEWQEELFGLIGGIEGGRKIDMGPSDYNFSIIIPTYNRPEQLADCLEAFTSLDYPPEMFEVIIVNDGGRDSLSGVIKPVSKKLNVTAMDQVNMGPAAARNNGASQARGRFLAFTDDDCLPEANWLSVLAETLGDKPKSMVGGPTINGLTENPFSAASQLIVDLVYAYYNADQRRARFLASNNMAMSAELFRLVGGFHMNFRMSEDRDLCDRWIGSGFRIIYQSQARVYHRHHLSLSAYWRQHRSYGEGAFRFNRYHARRDATSSTLNPDFYLQTLLSLPSVFSGIGRRQALVQAALLVLWQIANTAGFAIEGWSYLRKGYEI